MTERLLIFAEDPGAALFMQALPGAWKARGASVRVLSFPLVAPYFTNREMITLPNELNGSSAQVIVERERPAALVVGTSENPGSFAFDLVKAARDRGIPTFGAVDSVPNAERRFRGRSNDALAYAPDHLLVPDFATATRFEGLGFPRDRINRVGHPRLVELAHLRRQTAGQEWGLRDQIFPNAAGRPVIVFAAELSHGLDATQFRRSPAYALQGTSGSDRRTDVVAEELLRAARGLPDRPWLVLRLHPKQDLADMAEIAPHFDQVSRAEPALDVIKGSDLVTGMTSIFLVEAAVLGQRVLSIVPDPAERTLLGDMGVIIATVSDRASLEAALAVWPVPLPAGGFDGNPAAEMANAIARVIRPINNGKIPSGG